MKSVLLSIKPKFCELIASGKKTMEIRKNRPKIDVPFKCYIYCTKLEPIILKRSFVGKGKPSFDIIPKNDVDCYNQSYVWNGKVIGEFVCDGIYNWGADDLTYGQYYASDDELNDACLTSEELWNYAKGKTLYAWHISDLVMYDKPKELSEFYRKCNGIHCRGNDCEHWKHVRANADEFDMDCDCNELPPITRPPQNWCYVEELEETI